MPRIDAISGKSDVRAEHQAVFDESLEQATVRVTFGVIGL